MDSGPGVLVTFDLHVPTPELSSCPRPPTRCVITKHTVPYPYLSLPLPPALNRFFGDCKNYPSLLVRNHPDVLVDGGF